MTIYLYDADTDEKIGEATPAQHAASDAVEGAGYYDGIFVIDADGDPLAPGDIGHETGRRVYTYEPLVD